MTSRTMSVSIKRDPKTVYEFVFNLENLPKWANAAFQSIREQDGEWIVGTPQGSAKVRIIKKCVWSFGSLCYSTVWNGSVRCIAGSKE
jgi:uncharacterized membrane protein